MYDSQGHTFKSFDEMIEPTGLELELDAVEFHGTCRFASLESFVGAYDNYKAHQAHY